MRIKKILAGVTAGALAVSSLAVSAFADTTTYDFATGSSYTVYTAEAQLMLGSAYFSNGAGNYTLTISSDVYTDMSVSSATATIKYVDTDGNVQSADITWADSNSKVINIAATASVSADISKVDTACDYTVTVVATLESTTTEFTSDDWDGTTDINIAVSDDGDGSWTWNSIYSTSSYTADGSVSNTLSVPNATARDAAKSGTDATLTVKFDAVSAYTCVYLTYTDASGNEVSYAVSVASGATSATFTIPASALYVAGTEDNDYTVSYIGDLVIGNEVTVTSATLTYGDTSSSTEEDTNTDDDTDTTSDDTSTDDNTDTSDDTSSSSSSTTSTNTSTSTDDTDTADNTGTDSTDGDADSTTDIDFTEGTDEVEVEVSADEAIVIESEELGITLEADAGTFGESILSLILKIAAEVVHGTVSAIETAVAQINENAEVTVNNKLSISLFDQDGIKIQPNGSVKVTVPYDGVSNAVVYVSDNDKRVEFFRLTKNADGTVSFETTHFSDYYMVTLDEASLDEIVSAGTVDVEEEGTADGDTDADKNQNTGVALAVIPAAVAAAAVVVFKKK